jgi:hypothetical protein
LKICELNIAMVRLKELNNIITSRVNEMCEKNYEGELRKNWIKEWISMFGWWKTSVVVVCVYIYIYIYIYRNSS